MKTPEHDSKRGRLHERIGALIARGQFRRALELLDGIIEDALPLFQGEDWVTQERRLAWLYRIELLREAGRLTEALAWACLEVEIDPNNEFLVQLNEAGRNRILIIGATNLPDRIDPAVMRPGRLDKKFFVGPPDYEARFEMLRLCMANRPQGEIDWHDCAQQLEDYTSAEIEFVVNEAARHALSQNRPSVTGDNLHAAGNNPPAHTAADIEKLR